jgi:hypothetical protein
MLTPDERALVRQLARTLGFVVAVAIPLIGCALLAPNGAVLALGFLVVVIAAGRFLRR